MARLFRAFLADDDGRDEVFLLYSCISVGLVLLAGLMSGLTLALLPLDAVDLEVLLRSGTTREKFYAKQIEPVLRRPHFLLVTLVLCNAAATETLPIVLDRLADPYTAVIVSVIVVLIFGEIIPQAVCSRYGLAVGAYSAWLVKVLMAATSLVSWPISKCLDWALGNEDTALMRRTQLAALVDIHSVEGGLEGGYLSLDEINVIRGALDLTSKTAATCMTPMDKVFMLGTDTVLDEEMLMSILESGHSRIPIYRSPTRLDIVGLLLTKELILVDKHSATRVRDLKLRSVPMLRADTQLYDMLRLFETGRCHLAVLYRAPGEAGAAGLAAIPEKGGHEAAGASEARPNGGGYVLMPDPPGARRSGISRAHTRDIRQWAAGACPPGEPACQLASAPRHPEVEAEEGVREGGGGERGEAVGIITIEDVLEELLGAEIVDETDQFVDNLRQHRVNTGLLMRGLPRHLRQLLRQQKTRVGALGTLKARRQVIGAERGETPHLAPAHADGVVSAREPLLSSGQLTPEG